jgi:RHS repeat-associated protein
MLLVGEAASADVTFVHTDALGSPMAETNSAGQLVRLSHYKAYGEELEQQSDDVGYTGHKYDADLALSYMQARYYDPVIGRFYSNDPVGWTASNPVMSFNRYLYVNNNPYKYTDPNGEYLESVWDAASLSVGLTSLGSNLANGNWADAGLDALGVIADGAALALPVVPGGASMAISASRKGADFIATADGAVVHNSTSGVRNSLEDAGMSGTTVTNKAGTESGTIHNVPEMKMDVRVMDGGPNHPPRVVTSREGSSQAVNPANGSNFGNVPKTEQRARSHIELEK